MAISTAKTARPDGRVLMCGAFLAATRCTSNSSVANVRRASIPIEWKQSSARRVQRLAVPALRRKDTSISRDLIAKNSVAAAKARGCPAITPTASNTLSDLCALFCFLLCTLSVSCNVLTLGF
ncbi:PREDICTED: uncharacterized protein LOC104343384 [Leptosomus discolor]|uniref:uncharacterized protein LOC104343384 n=1 Tax=Leptosomus discolor TaxID=188344 RepID=UPI0005224082|nr:PREDICTED: uncharacterized protein LOC104343384 [Leptosomus discolor]